VISLLKFLLRFVARVPRPRFHMSMITSKLSILAAGGWRLAVGGRRSAGGGRFRPASSRSVPDGVRRQPVDG